MPSEENTLLDIYTLIMKEEDTLEWEQNFPGLQLLAKEPLMFDLGYSVVKINVLPCNGFDECSPIDIIDLTGAIALHQEYTNGFISDELGLGELNNIYVYEGAAYAMMGEMLTEDEKLNIIFNYIWPDHEKFTIDDLVYSASSLKEKIKWIPLKGNEDKLFGENIGKIGLANDENTTWTTWWAEIIEKLDFYIIVVDEDEIEDDEEDTPSKRSSIPYPDDEDDEEAWNDYYRRLSEKYYGDREYDDYGDDDYLFDIQDNYIDKWYEKKGYK